MMFNLPEKTLYQKKIPKNKFYEKLQANRKLREKFVRQVDQVVWKHKISQETVNIEPTKDVPEIQVFEVHLKQRELSPEVLESIDRAILYPVLFALIYKNQVRLAMAYKKPGSQNRERSVVEHYFYSDWQNINEFSMELLKGLNLQTVYDNMIKRLMPLEVESGQDLEEAVQRQKQAEKLELEIAKLESKINKERQFNRKVKLNLELQEKKKELQQVWDKEDIHGQA